MYIRMMMPKKRLSSGTPGIILGVCTTARTLEANVMNAARFEFEHMPTSYNALVAMHPPRPLRDLVDERNVEEIIAELAGHKLSADQEDYLDLLSDLLLKYQSENRPAKRTARSPHARLSY